MTLEALIQVLLGYQDKGYKLLDYRIDRETIEVEPVDGWRQFKLGPGISINTTLTK